MIPADRWRSNWTVVAPPDSIRVSLPRSRQARRRSRELSELPIGTPVVLLASGPAAAGRCRRFAAAAGVRVEGEYLAFPSALAPAYLVDDSPAAVRTFVTHVLVAPPRTKLSAVIDGALALLRVATPWRVVRTLAPGRVAVGRRA